MLLARAESRPVDVPVRAAVRASASPSSNELKPRPRAAPTSGAARLAPPDVTISCPNASKLVGAGLSLYQLRTVRPILEDLFLDLTSGANLSSQDNGVSVAAGPEG